MYKNTRLMITEKHALYSYCKDVTSVANNIENRTTYLFRQVLTAVNSEQLNTNQQEVMESLNKFTSETRFKMPEKGKWFMSYEFLNAYFNFINDKDYKDSRIAKQSAQNCVKQVVSNMGAFCKAIKAYKTHPEDFTGRPKLPGYHKSGGTTTVKLSNQDCVLYGDELKLPKTKIRLKVPEATGKLIEVKITPFHDVFYVYIVYDTQKEAPAARKSKRIIAIDEGVNNFAAITNNIGAECLLFKGGVIKAINQYYNKVLAREQSKQPFGEFEPTEISEWICVKRNNVINDCMHKFAKTLIGWCIKYDIDTIVVGKNKYWKQDANMGHKNNQEFVQIPFDKFNRMIEYLAVEQGINVIYQEESYTSKASFIDKDDIPVYGEVANEPTFSGRRICRGLYKTKDGQIINADLNGSANILRKAFPGDFDVNFSNVVIIKHTDSQLKKTPTMSKSKQRRINKKYSF